MKLSLELQQTPTDLLKVEALEDARAIISRASLNCAFGSQRANEMLFHAMDRLKQEINAETAGIFADDES
jgi:hypothetical protein